MLTSVPGAELTRPSPGARGGSANLVLEQSEEPYLAGVTYTTMPPAKRFRDMDQLSGGEKVGPMLCPAWCTMIGPRKLPGRHDPRHHASRQALPEHGPALGQREGVAHLHPAQSRIMPGSTAQHSSTPTPGPLADAGGPGAAVCGAQLQPRAVLCAGRGGRCAGLRQRGARGGLHPQQGARQARFVAHP